MGQPHSNMVCCIYICPTMILQLDRRDHDQILSQIKLFLVDEVLIILGPFTFINPVMVDPCTE